MLGHIREAAPEPSKPFAWLDPHDQRMGVFVPVLMGAGLVMSGLAWLIERLARRTAGPALERGLAGQLSALALPDRLVADDDGFALLRRPAIHWGVKKALVILAVAAVAAVGVDMLGDATQTRPDPKRPNSRTELIFRVQTLGQTAGVRGGGTMGRVSGHGVAQGPPAGDDGAGRRPLSHRGATRTRTSRARSHDGLPRRHDP